MKITCLLAFLSLLGPLAKADEWDKRTVVTFNQPVEVPGIQNHGHGIVLGPGTYVMKLAATNSERDIVQIFNSRESHVYTTTIAIPEYRLEPTGHTVIDFAERPKGSPEALKDWYYPGDLRGEEFLYARPLNMIPSATPAHKQLASVTKPEPAPAPQPAAQAEPAPAPQQQAPVQMAEAAPAPAPVPAPAPAPQKEAKKLPKTASDLPLIGLLGVVFSGTGLVLRKSNA